jgi:hypothetical protein
VRRSPCAVQDLLALLSHGWQSSRPKEILRILRREDGQWQGIAVSKFGGNQKVITITPSGDQLQIPIR